MPSTAIKPAVTKADVCRRIGSSFSEPGKRRVTQRSAGPPQVACPPNDRNRRNLHSAKTTGGGRVHAAAPSNGMPRARPARSSSSSEARGSERRWASSKIGRIIAFPSSLHKEWTRPVARLARFSDSRLRGAAQIAFRPDDRERSDQMVNVGLTVQGRGGQAQPLGAARHGRVVDRLHIDLELVE